MNGSLDKRSHRERAVSGSNRLAGLEMSLPATVRTATITQRNLMSLLMVSVSQLKVSGQVVHKKKGQTAVSVG